jgi:phage FluMu protein Com
MPSTITFQCYSCNQVLKVGSDKAGKKAKCIKCGTILTIPVQSDEEEEVRSGPPRRSSRDEDEDDRPRKRRSRDEQEDEEDDRARSRRRDYDDEDEEDRPRKRRSRDDDDEDEDDRPRSRRRRDEEEDDEDYDRPRKRSRDRDYEEEDDYDRGRRRKGGGSPWPKVRVGLMLNSISAGMLAGYAGLMFLGLLMVFIAGRAASLGMLRFAGVLILIGFMLFFALQVLSVTAYVFFLFTPNKKGSFGLAITSLILGGINLVLKLLMVLSILGADMGGPGIGGPGMGGPGLPPPIFGRSASLAVAIMLMILVLLLLDSEWIIVPLYLRAVCKTIKDRYSEGGCLQALGFACGAIGSQLLAILLTLTARSEAMFWITFFLMLIAYGILLAFAIIYMRVNLAVRANVD